MAKVLLAKKTELLSGIRRKLGTMARQENAATEDLAPVFHDQFVASQLNQLDYKLLQLVNEANDRMTRGIYGVCAECDEPISPRRLQAIPWAIRCVPCEEAWIHTGGSVETGVEAAA